MRGALKIVLLIVLSVAGFARATPITALRTYAESLDSAVVDFYADPDAKPVSIAVPDELLSAFDAPIRAALESQTAATTDLPTRVGAIRGTLQQAITLKMAAAVSAGDLDEAKRWRCELFLPRGVTSAEGALLLETLGGKADKRADAVKLLTREAVTWQTTRVRQLLSEAARSTQQPHAMPGRLREHLAEAATLADLPPALATAAGLTEYKSPAKPDFAPLAVEWSKVGVAFTPIRKSVESALPSLLSDAEKVRRERLLLKLVMLVPREYAPGVRDGKIVVPLEYREAVAFTAQAQQLLGELAPLWLAQSSDKRDALEKAEKHLETAEATIARIAPADEVEAVMKEAAGVLQNDLGITLARRGTTADIVDEVMLETRSLLNRSLAAALAGNWKEAEQSRLEAYTTYDPELEARLMPRDPQLATDIEHLLLDGLDHPGVKELLDRRAGQAELEIAYGRVSEGLNKAAVLLKSGVSPSAAAINAASVVLREGLEGLLVIIAIFAGLRGKENARRRRLFWVGVLGSVVVTALTWILSQTVMTSLRAHGETIAAITGIVAIAVLLLITNWLFQQVYWKQWITTLKATAVEGESIWALLTAGFAVGYREGLETVLFLQSLVLDAGGTPVAAGVAVGSVLLIGLGILSLYVGMKLPYFKLLLITAALIGLVLVTFTGGTVRAMQTVGWLPVHKLTPTSWPIWTGNWLGLYNTWESVLGQAMAITLVLGTWAVARWSAKRKSKQRRAAMAACRVDAAT
ncbi:MAG: High-affinity iron transporter, partial [Phycisphaerales bacterium]|nr:High-affinity iron transporter [Phycisphaerales bacterium]